MALNSLDFLSTADLHVKQCRFLSDKTGARKLYLRLKIFLWLGGLTYFALLGAGRLHAGEAKPSSGGEWERTVEAAKKEGKVVVSIPASAELRRGIEKVFKQRFGMSQNSMSAEPPPSSGESSRSRSPAYLISMSIWGAANR